MKTSAGRTSRRSSLYGANAWKPMRAILDQTPRAPLHRPCPPRLRDQKQLSSETRERAPEDRPADRTPGPRLLAGEPLGVVRAVPAPLSELAGPPGTLRGQLTRIVQSVGGLPNPTNGLQ